VGDNVVRVDPGFALTVPGAIGGRIVEELDAVITGRNVEIEINGDRAPGLDRGCDHREVEEIVGPGVGVAGVVARDAVVVQVDAQVGVGVYGVAQNRVVASSDGIEGDPVLAVVGDDVAVVGSDAADEVAAHRIDVDAFVAVAEW
jgi:hypothetical protein